MNTAAIMNAITATNRDLEAFTLTPAPQPPTPQLTERETQILALVSEGETNSAIAAKMFLTTGTVRNYVSSILMKLNAPNRAAAASYFVRSK